MITTIALVTLGLAVILLSAVCFWGYRDAQTEIDRVKKLYDDEFTKCYNTENERDMLKRALETMKLAIEESNRNQLFFNQRIDLLSAGIRAAEHQVALTNEQRDAALREEKRMAALWEVANDQAQRLASKLSKFTRVRGGHGRFTKFSGQLGQTKNS